MSQITFESPLIWLLPIALVSLGLAAWLYFIGKKFTRGQRIFLAVLRFLIFFFLGILLLSPLLKTSERIEEKPILVWLEDRSRSMVSNADSQSVKTNFSESEKLLNDLKERYEIQRFSFHKNLQEPSDSFAGSGTDLHSAISETRENFYNQNVGAAVVLTDGIFNLGSDPAYAAQGLPFPLFTVGFGDTVVKNDLFVERIIANDVSYLGNEFPVEIYLRARGFDGENFKLSVRNAAGSELFSKTISIGNNDFFQRENLFLKAGKVGLQRFTVSVSPLNGEANSQNNFRSFSVEILDNRKKVAVIGSAPHPDMAAVFNALQTVEKYEVQSYLYNESWAGSSPDAAVVDKPEVLILHNPNAEMLGNLDEKTPVWIIQGEKTPPQLLQDKTGVLSGGQGFEDVSAKLNLDFNLFTVEEKNREWARDLPPLFAPFGRPETSGRTYPLFTKKVGRVETSDPIWFFSQNEETRRAFTLGTGLWRWRIEDYRQNKSFANFDGLISQTVQYLSANQNQRRFITDLPDRLDKNEPLRGEARLLDQSLALTNQPEVQITLTDEAGKDFQFSFSKSEKTYALNAGRLPAGNYRWKARTELGDETFAQSGNLAIEASERETADLTARHGLLRKMSRESGGQFFKQNQIENLKDALLQNPEAKSFQRLETKTGSLMDLRWIFAIFLFLMGLEWGLRKYFGNY